jgi:hypothetical protein
MASLAATEFQPLFPNLTVYTFGEPQTGDALYVQAVETNFLAASPSTTKYFRSTRKQNYCLQNASGMIIIPGWIGRQACKSC